MIVIPVHHVTYKMSLTKCLHNQILSLCFQCCAVGCFHCGLPKTGHSGENQEMNCVIYRTTVYLVSDQSFSMVSRSLVVPLFVCEQLADELQATLSQLENQMDQPLANSLFPVYLTLQVIHKDKAFLQKRSVSQSYFCVVTYIKHCFVMYSQPNVLTSLASRIVYPQIKMYSPSGHPRCRWE